MSSTMSFGLALAIGTIPVLVFALGYLFGSARMTTRTRRVAAKDWQIAKAYGTVDCEPEY
jgi:hypothetical protein